MNQDKRKELAKAIELLEEAKTIIEDIQNQEQECFDNLSENLQQSERGQRFEEIASQLGDAVCNIDDLISEVESASE